MPAWLTRGELFPEGSATLGIEPFGRLVEEEDLGPMDERRRQVESPPHAARVGARELAGDGRERHEFEQLVDPSAQLRFRHAMEPSDKLKVLAPGREVVDRHRLHREADAPSNVGRMGDNVEARHQRPP